MDDGRALDDHVVDDVRATPPAPPRDPDERARSPPRNARLAPAERHPTDHGRPDTDRHRDPTPTEEGDERRRVHWRDDDGTRRPPPVAIVPAPATVVIRRPAPRQVVDPGPAVERIPDPPAGAVGRPRGGHRGRDPHRTVLGLVTPAPVAVEVVGTIDLLRNVACALRVRQVIGALVIPPVPRIEVGCRVALDLGVVGALHDHLVVRAEIDRLAARRDDARAAAAPADERGGLLVDVDAVVAGLVDDRGEMRRVDLDRVAALEAAEVDRRVPGGDLQLQEIRLDGVESEIGLAAGAHERPRTGLHLDVSPLGNVQRVTARERGVHPRRRPVFRTRAPERHVAVQVAQPRRRGRRLGRFRRSGRFRGLGCRRLRRRGRLWLLLCVDRSNRRNEEPDRQQRHEPGTSSDAVHGSLLPRSAG